MTGKRWWTWSSLDNRVLEAALGLALLLVGLFGVVLPILGVMGPLSPIRTRVVELDDLTQGPDIASAGSVTLRGTRTAELAFAHPDLTERLLLVLPDIVRASLVLLILELLRRMARALREGEIFAAQNARRLTIIALAVLVMGAVVPVLDAITTRLLVSGADLGRSIPFSYPVSGAWLLLALLVAAAAEAFRQGARLRADTEGLV